MQSLAAILIAKLETIVGVFDRLIDASTIDYDPGKVRRWNEESDIAIIAIVPDSSWGPLDDRQRGLQRQLLELWRPWIAQATLLFSSDTITRKKDVSGAAKKIDMWIERNGADFSIPSTVEQAHAVIRNHAAPLFEALGALNAGGSVVVVVPDTNVILRSPDVAKYRDVLGVDAFTVMLVPGVLAEVDEHKVNHRNEAVRERARKFSGRIKGWRAQGDLAVGVKVEGSVFVRVEGREPNFSQTLSWLDKDVSDDRIIASVLEIQRRDPSACVVLLTGDAVMLAKADTASVPTADTPDPEI